MPATSRPTSVATLRLYGEFVRGGFINTLAYRLRSSTGSGT